MKVGIIQSQTGRLICFQGLIKQRFTLIPSLTRSHPGGDHRALCIDESKPGFLIPPAAGAAQGARRFALMPVMFNDLCSTALNLSIICEGNEFAARCRRSPDIIRVEKCALMQQISSIVPHRPNLARNCGLSRTGLKILQSKPAHI